MSHTHNFHPAQPKQEKVSFDCSLPQTVSSIKKVTTALPYPTDLSQALDYSAAYVDHAAHLAKHAQEQFKNLQTAHKNLHATSVEQLAEIESLKCHVRVHEEDIRGLNSKNAELEKQRERDAKEAREREDTLKKQLNDAQNELKKAQVYIVKDKADDIKRDNAHHAHIDADHLIIKQAEERAIKAEKRCVDLQSLLDAANQELVVVKASLETTREQLATSVATVSKLTTDLAAETQLRAKAQKDFEAANANVIKANTKILDQVRVIAAREATIEENKVTIGERESETDSVRDQMKAIEKAAGIVSHNFDLKLAEIKKSKAEHSKALAENAEEIAKLKAHHKTEHELAKEPRVGVVEAADVF